MNADTFLQNFRHLADAPGGVQRLREMVLELAVQGKLVEQDAGDEPAAVLLDRMREEREQLIGLGTIKKSKPAPPVMDDDIPHPIPNGWEWTRLRTAGLINPRNNADDDLEVSFVPMTLIPDTYGAPPDSEPRRWADIRSGYTHFADGDAVMAKITPCFQNRKSTVMRGLHAGIGAGTTELYVLRPFAKAVPEYVVIFLKSPNFVEHGVRNMTGSAGQKRVPKKYFSDTPFPLPPLAEQERIVAKVDELMALCDELEARQRERRAVHVHLNDAALDRLTSAENDNDFETAWTRVRSNFDLLYSVPENVNALRQSILQLAVQGKLVEQDPDDEPAIRLIEKIETEKERRVSEGLLRRTGEFDEVPEQDQQWSAPSGWEWVRFGKVTIHRDGERVPLSKDVRRGRKGPYDYYGASGVIDHIDDFIFDQPLLLIGEDGANLVLRSKPIAFIADGQYWVNNHAHVLDSVSLDCLRYLEVFVNAIDLRPYVTGTAQPKMNQAKMNAIPVAFPPENEQKRIVERVEQLMALCDELEGQLARQRSDADRLTEAMVAAILDGAAA
jgi:type I restriction enzyme S subunit